MAIGFSPKYVQDITLDNLSATHFLVLAIEAAKKLDWNIGYITENGFIAYTKFSMSSWSEEITVKIENGSVNLKSECTGSQLMDLGKNKENIKNLIATLTGLQVTMSADDIAIKLEELKPNLVPAEEDILNKPPSTTKDKITSFFSIFKPVEGYFITPILLNLNMAIFTIMAITGVNIVLPDNESLLTWGANFRPLTLGGDWWRLITNCFLHIGVFHLLMNMYALLYIGLLLEPFLGRTRFIAAYLLTGIAASITSLWWHDFTISAGASGAIFGMYGVFLALLTTNFIDKAARKALLTSIAVFVGYNLINGLKGGIDNAAHIGGLISGLFMGYVFIPSLKKPETTNLKLGTIGLLTVLVLTTSFIVCKKLPNDIGTYDAKMKEFVSMEAMALEVFKMPQNTPTDKLLFELKDREVYYWQENLKLIDEVEKLNLPFEIHQKNLKLKKYCELRIKSYELIYKAVLEKTDQYTNQVEDYNNQIETIITDLGAGQQAK